MSSEMTKCCICGNTQLDLVLDLGEQVLTGVFPKTPGQEISAGPLQLIKCRETDAEDSCGLLQLRHQYPSSEMYGDNYGYRSGLNKSMVDHLQSVGNGLQNIVALASEDIVVDIGSNDSTLLQTYPNNLTLIGIDPSGTKFSKYYPEHVRLVPELFSAENLQRIIGAQKAKVITSLSMFYDLPSPLEFMREIIEVLADDGVWFFEQSYMPTMLEMNSYDTVCHEHLEYYRLKQIKWMGDQVGLKIIDVTFNDVNGGSFAVTMAKKCNTTVIENSEKVNSIIADEEAKGLSSLAPYLEFCRRMQAHKFELLQFLNQLKQDGKTIVGYGASTKGNVILQYCGITEQLLPCIAEVNEDKFGSFTPGTLIPIVSEAEAKALKPDYMLVLPWHFKTTIIQREAQYLQSGGHLIFPLPTIEVI